MTAAPDESDQTHEGDDRDETDETYETDERDRGEQMYERAIASVDDDFDPTAFDAEASDAVLDA